jgi:putative hydrolase of the HAD superfamily
MPRKSALGRSASGKPIAAVVFDRDGVLTYFDLDAVRSFLGPRLHIGVEELIGRWQQWGETTGWPRSPQEERRFWQGFWDDVCNDLAIHCAARTELQAFDYTTAVRPFPDARPALLYARQCGLRIGVLSNFSLASLQESLVAAGLADLVDVACAATVIGAAKPDARSYEAVLEGLGVGPEETIFFDDELPCVEGARALGMHAYLIDRWKTQQGSDSGVARDLGVLETLLGANAEGRDG